MNMQEANSAIHIDGSLGEGGGQMLRSALTLPMLSGKSLNMSGVRRGRSKPGMMRQHLVSVQAAQQVCSAQVRGAELGSTELEFVPGRVAAGDYRFAIGTAVSTMLVLQTLLPALLRADAASTLLIEGGTHNGMAPSADFIARAFLPMLQKMSARVDLQVKRLGFYPTGGGAVLVAIQPATLKPLDLEERGAALGIEARALLLGLPTKIALRELTAVADRLKLRREQLHVDESTQRGGTGNALQLIAAFEHVREVVTCLGEHGVSSEIVASRACAELERYLAHDAPVGEHLADQLLLPMLIAGGGAFMTAEPSAHLMSNIAVIEAFGMASVRIEALPYRSPAHRARVIV
jgi:RNA 3'-terminal phosphate cyclase (ATP)